MTYPSATNLDIPLSRFVILECVTFSTRLIFYETEGVANQKQEYSLNPQELHIFYILVFHKLLLYVILCIQHLNQEVN